MALTTNTSKDSNPATTLNNRQQVQENNQGTNIPQAPQKAPQDERQRQLNEQAKRETPAQQLAREQAASRAALQEGDENGQPTVTYRVEQQGNTVHFIVEPDGNSQLVDNETRKNRRPIPSRSDRIADRAGQ